MENSSIMGFFSFETSSASTSSAGSASYASYAPNARYYDDFYEHQLRLNGASSSSSSSSSSTSSNYISSSSFGSSTMSSSSNNGPDPSLSLLSPSLSNSLRASSGAAIKPYTGSIQTRSASTAAAAAGSMAAATEGIAARTAGRTAGAGAGSSGSRVKDFLRTPVMVSLLPFINGGISGMVATAVVQPIDMVKVRLQLDTAKAEAGVAKPNALSIARGIIAKNPLDLYTGLSAGLLRQAVYTTARLGFFDTFMKSMAASAKEQGRQVGFAERAGAGLGAGGLAALIGNPADLALIRMQSDGLKPAHLRSNYRSVFHALSDITKSEGVLALWNGATPTVVRAMALNFGQLAFFSEAKSQLKTLGDQGYHSMSTQAQTLTASAVAGFFASFFSLPFDFLKTRMQKQAKAGGQKMGMWGTFMQVAKEEGPLRVYRGLPVYYTRIAPHAMVTLLVADYLGFITK